MKNLHKKLLISLIFVPVFFVHFPLEVSALQIKKKTIVTPRFHIDKIYTSMMGPSSSQKFSLIENEPRQLLWITAYKSRVLDANNPKTELKDFMCHSNLNIDIKSHRTLFGWRQYPSERFFTLSEGRETINFPKGFGIPVYSDEVFKLDSQALNHNIENLNVQVKIENVITFVRNKNLKTPMNPLVMSAANGLALLKGKDGYYGVLNGDHSKHGTGSSKGVNAHNAKVRKDIFGREFTGHWEVPPGRHTYKTLVTRWMNLPYDTSAHFISAHVHPFAESLELRDLKTGNIIFKTKIENQKNKIGLALVPTLSSEEGKPLYKDREYELISVYNNTSQKPITVMAVMFLYLFDKEFDKTNLNNSTLNWFKSLIPRIPKI
jgi:hypothetical protein